VNYIREEWKLKGCNFGKFADRGRDILCGVLGVKMKYIWRR